MYINFVNNNNNTNFKSRSAEIRFADDIARKVNQEFPRISSTKIQDFKNVKRYFDLYRKIKIRIQDMRYAKTEAYDSAYTLSDKLLAITSTIKRHKVGNCGESAELTEIAARVNGIDDCFCASVFGKNYFNYKHNLDHVVLFVKNNKKPYIIDSWLGFADYLPEAIKRWQKEYRMHFDFNKCRGEKMYLKKYIDFGYDQTGEVFKNKYTVEDLRNLYPELIIKKSADKSNTTL